MNNKKAKTFFIVYEKCPIAGNVFTFLEVSFLPDDRYCISCHRAVYCEELKLKCWFADFKSKEPFNFMDMIEYVRENGFEDDDPNDFDPMEKIMEYVVDGEYEEEKLCNALFELTNIKIDSREGWIQWYKKHNPNQGKWIDERLSQKHGNNG